MYQNMISDIHDIRTLAFVNIMLSKISDIYQTKISDIHDILYLVSRVDMITKYQKYQKYQF